MKKEIKDREDFLNALQAGWCLHSNKANMLLDSTSLYIFVEGIGDFDFPIKDFSFERQTVNLE